jgi:ADP-heptose:LPS heptosyltransferase
MISGSPLAHRLRPLWMQRIGRWLALLGILCLDWLATLRARPPQAPGAVLIVRLDAIGDFVLWQRSARHYRALYPTQRLVLAANATWTTLAECLPYWDEVIPIDMEAIRSDLCYRLRLLGSLSRRRFGVALHPTHSRSILYGDSVVRATRATVRIGSAGDLANISVAQKALSDRWYTRLVPTTGEPLAELDRHLHFLQALGWRGLDPTKRSADQHLPTVARLPAKVVIKSPYCIVFPGASWGGRQWPVSAFAELIDAMARECPSRTIALCGGEAERELCTDLEARSHAATVNMAGATSLPEFCELVRRADFLVGNETSAIHIASVVGTPSVSIVGGGHFGRFVPYPEDAGDASPVPVHERMPCYGCNWRCHLPHADGGPVPCISAITVGAVLAAVRRIAPAHTAVPAV